MIVYFHLPKCGGTSLKDSLQGHFNRCVIDRYPHWSSTDRLRLHIDFPDAPVTLLYFHEYTYGPESYRHRFVMREEDFVFTILRHPVPWLQSLFWSLKGPFDSTTHEYALALARSEPGRPFFTLLAAARNFEQFVDWLLDMGTRLPGCTDYVTQVFDRDALGRMHYVGILERMDVTVIRLRAALGLPGLQVEHRNVGLYSSRGNPVIYRQEELGALLHEAIAVYERVAALLPAGEGAAESGNPQEHGEHETPDESVASGRLAGPDAPETSQFDSRGSASALQEE